MRLLKICGVLFVFLFSVFVVVAVPTGPTNTNLISSGRFPLAGGSNLSAVAGNVTEVDFQSNAVTSTWQGYYGNVSGSIKLGDSNNNTLYDWTAASPSGEIYATRASATPAWASVVCASTAQVNTEDVALGVNAALDSDAANRTFLNTTLFNQFYVGNVNINTTQDCRAVQLYNFSGASSANFQEVLLHDGTSMIYTGLLTRDSTGFDNRPHDFEMMVGENGHNGDVASTLYYFYVELG